MNKLELIDTLRGECQISKKEAATFVDLFFHKISAALAEGDRVAFRGVVRATHTAEFMGIPASGKQIVVPVIGIAQLARGKIAEWWNSPDRLSWMQQIGAIPS